jgi:hypothetical protein
MLDNGGNYSAKITYRHLGEYSPIVNAADIQGAFWDSDNENDIVSILPLYGPLGYGTVTTLTPIEAYQNVNGYYLSGELRRLSILSTVNTINMFVGGPNDTANNGGRQTLSAEWNFGTGVGGVLRCVKNAQDPEIPGTDTSLPAWTVEVNP